MSTDWPKVERGGSPYGACPDHTTRSIHSRTGARSGLVEELDGGLRGLVRDWKGCRHFLGSPLLFNVKLEKEIPQARAHLQGCMTPFIAQHGSANVPRTPVCAMQARAGRLPEESTQNS